MLIDIHDDNDDCSLGCPPPQPTPHPPNCPCLNQDFVLACGVEINVQPGKEVHHDFTLEPNPFKDCGTLSGIVKDKSGHGIPNALVKVFDTQHRPVAHVFTNKEGQFLLCLAPGRYIVKAVK